MSNSSIFAKRVYRYGPNIASATNVVANWTETDTGDSTALSTEPLPDGRVETVTLAADSTTGDHSLYQTITLTANEYEASFLVKPSGLTKTKTKAYIGTTASAGISYFNLSTVARGTVGTGHKARIKKLANGWYRCQTRFTGSAAAWKIKLGVCDADNSPNIASGDGTANAYIGDFSVRRCYEQSDTKAGDYVGVFSSDEGGLVIGGIDVDNQSFAARVSHANATRSADEPVLLTQNINAAGGTASSVAVGTLTSAQLEAIKTAVQIMDDWDASDRCKVSVSSDTSAQLEAIKTAVQIIDDWDVSDRCRVTLTSVNTVALAVNAGNNTNGTLRVAVATDDVNLAAQTTSLALIDDVISTVAAAVKTKTAAVGVSDGTNARHLLGDSSGVVYNQPYTVPTFEDATNGLAKVQLNGRAKYAPTATGPTTIGTLTICLASTDMSTYGPFWLYMYNDGAAALTTCNVEVSPDGTTGWYPLSVKDADETACATLAATTMGVAYKFSAGLQGYLRVRASTGSSTTVTVWIVAQK